MLKITLIVVAAFALSCNAEVRFRRDAADVSMMQENIDALSEDITNQARTIEFVSTLADSVASSDYAGAVRDDVRFLIERSLQFADANDLASLTSVVTTAASRAQDLNTRSVSFATALPALQSTARRSLSSAIASFDANYDNLLASADSIEDRYIAMSEEAQTLIDSLSTQQTEYNNTLNFLEMNNDNGHALIDALLSATSSFDSDTYNKISSSFTQYFGDGSQTYARWWWRTWSTYSQNNGWYAGNNVHGFGGIAPSNWGNGRYRAYQMSKDMGDLRSFFHRRGSGGPNANIWAEEWYYYSSTNSYHTGILFRIKNDQSTTISWRPYFYHTNYNSWEEVSSASLNGAEVWSHTGNCNSNCASSVALNLPPRSISTFILIVSSGGPSSTRPNAMAFYNNCLNLPNGLSWVDDFSVAEELNTPLD
eukprot:m.15655 g.15655  ORF g.15655 m.15655 type:complete len:424 (+) comp7880_c0_seq1:57-1328(+)